MPTKKSDAGGEGRRCGGSDRPGAAGGSVPTWQEVTVPSEQSVRAREWRIVVETLRLGGQQQRPDRAGEVIVGLELELKEVLLIGSCRL